MVAETKADFARRHKVNRSTVTKWESRGLLVFTDGGLVDVERTEWNLDQRPPTYRGGTAHRPIRGPDSSNASHAQARPKPPPKPSAAEPAPEVPADLLRDTIVAMIQRTEAVTAFAVIAAGAGSEAAFAAAGIARLEAIEAGSHLALSLGVPDGDDGPLGVVAATTYPPDWPALAALAGEPVTLDRWRKAEAALPFWKDGEPEEAPHPWAAGLSPYPPQPNTAGEPAS